jgi:molybdopterin-biosynthesis enzyme MoeA-like protein
MLRLAGGTTVLCLPGAPEEALAVLGAAMPLMRDAAPRGQVAQREVESPTADEAALRPLLERLAAEYPGVWIASRPPGAGREARSVITLEAAGPTVRAASAAVDRACKRLLALAAGSP